MQLVSLPWSHEAALLQIVIYMVVEKGIKNEEKQK